MTSVEIINVLATPWQPKAFIVALLLIFPADFPCAHSIVFLKFSHSSSIMLTLHLNCNNGVAPIMIKADP